ncbi:MAG: uncharacterized protein A8A55_3404, partial [Amphiamblys sp. WSBS2006]
LFKLLEKTHVVVGENVSVFGNFKGEDCIREGVDVRELYLLRPASFSRIESNICFMENVAGITNNSIKLGRVKKLELWGYPVNILPRLVLHGENVMDEFCLNADKKEHVAEIIRVESKSIWLGKMKRLELRDYAVNVLPKLVLHGENIIEELRLDAAKKEHVSEIMKTKDSSTRLGKVKKFESRRYASNIVQKLCLEYVE